MPKRAVEVIKILEDLEWFEDIRHDSSGSHFYFPPNEQGAIYGIKVDKRGKVTAVFYAVKFWDVEIDFEELLDSVSSETANILIYNIDIFREISNN